MTEKRAFVIVLDGVGAGEAPDSAEFGDSGAFSLKSAHESGKLNIPNLLSMGLGNIKGLEFLGTCATPGGACGLMREISRGKDTTTGHWEIAGIVSEDPPPVYPDGFPAEIIESFEKATGRGVLVNKPYSGTAVISEYGEEHIKTGKLIVYTSADSVFQIAAHTDVVPLEELYGYCEKARKILCGKHAVGRVIARPFAGKAPDFYRTADRRDFSVEPSNSVLDDIKKAGKEVIAVGKISDIFAGKGITRSVPVHGNPDCMEAAYEIAGEDFEGFCFINLVDTDSSYGHRRDAEGYAECISAFDKWLGGFCERMRSNDLLIITADHGCDPGYKGTDHTRELVPLAVYGKKVLPADLGVRGSFTDVAASVAEWLGVEYNGPGVSFVGECTDSVTENKELLKAAVNAMELSYSPYSMCTVGAALLCADGTVYTGANIESASYTPTVCAERSAFIRAICDGKRRFKAIAVCGENKKLRREGDLFYPCGVCRQFMREFCGEDFKILVTSPRGDRVEVYTLGQLLPKGFGPDNVI